MSRTFFLGIGLSASAISYADFMPPNNLHLEDGLLRGVQVTEKDFNEAIDEAEVVYGPLIQQAFGARLRINRLWSNSTVNASASQFGSTWDVNMYGGLARRPEITRDGFSIVICHELGHHLGGYPFTSAWAANEGQSDYYATLSCARLLWKDQTEKNAESAELIPELPKAQCDAVWETEEDRNLCYRVMLAGKSTADLLSALGGSTASWDTPDQRKVSSTNNAHPQGQCRLDTYAAGALCVANFDETIIPAKTLGNRRNSADAERISAQYTCTNIDSFEIGTRPLCWFKPFIP